MAEIITSLSELPKLLNAAEVGLRQIKHTGPVMMMLGPYMFAVDTTAYNQLGFSVEYRWNKQERLGRKPSMQYSGPGGESISLEGSIYPGYVGDVKQIQAMRDLASTGLPQYLVDGTGRYYGEWVITSIEETSSIFLNNGSAQKIDFTLSLENYGKDNEKSNNKWGF